MIIITIFRDRILLYRPGWLQTFDPAASASHVWDCRFVPSRPGLELNFLQIELLSSVARISTILNANRRFHFFTMDLFFGGRGSLKRQHSTCRNKVSLSSGGGHTH